MPRGVCSFRCVLARGVTLAALGMAAVVVGIVVLGGGTSYEVRLRLQNASQLVKGDLVKVGGVPVGDVRGIDLTSDNQAELRLRITDGELDPLHEGTRAVVRQTSLSGVANRYVALAPGPNDAPAVADGGVIDADRTRSSVDLDILLNTLDGRTRAALQGVVRRGADTLAGAERDLNAGLEALDPALGQAAATAREVMRDEDAFRDALVETASVVSAVAPRSEELSGAIRDTGAVLEAVAGERGALADALDRAPDTLRRTNTTLLNVRAALRDLDPALREAGPVAPRLARLLDELEPVALAARPAVARARRLVPDLLTALERLPATERSATPAFASATSALEEALPIVAAARSYVPDVVAGLLNGFGGTTAGYYDANGHYARIALEGSPYSLNTSGSLIPVPPSDGSLAGYRKGLVARCPGGATQAHPDGSNPVEVAGCDPGTGP